MGFRWATTSTSLYCLCASARSCQPLIYLLSWPHWGLGCTEVSRAMSAPRFQTHLTLSHTALWADLDLCLGFCFSVDLKLLTLLWSGWWTSLKCYLVGGKRLAGGNISSSTSAEAWNQVKEQFDMAHHQIRRVPFLQAEICINLPLQCSVRTWSFMWCTCFIYRHSGRCCQCVSSVAWLGLTGTVNLQGSVCVCVCVL